MLMVEATWIRVLLPHWSWLPLNSMLNILSDSPKDNRNTVNVCKVVTGGVGSSPRGGGRSLFLLPLGHT